MALVSLYQLYHEQFQLTIINFLFENLINVLIYFAMHVS